MHRLLVPRVSNPNYLTLHTFFSCKTEVSRYNKSHEDDPQRASSRSHLLRPLWPSGVADGDSQRQQADRGWVPVRRVLRLDLHPRSLPVLTDTWPQSRETTMDRNPLLESAKIKEEIIFLWAKMIHRKINIAMSEDDDRKIEDQILQLKNFIAR